MVRRQDWRPDLFIVDFELVRDDYRDEVLDAYFRARRAGAPRRLRFVGMGAFGIVFCEEVHARIAWKVYRHPETPSAKHLVFLRTVLHHELEFFRAAAESPVSDSVARGYRQDEEEIVLERECVPGRPGGGRDEEHLRELHRRIAKAVEPLGWSAPEFKPENFILGPDGWKLVDAGGAHALGMTLAAYVEAWFEGRVAPYYTASDLAYFVIREYQEKALPADVVRDLLARLIEVNPGIRESFSTPRELGL